MKKVDILTRYALKVLANKSNYLTKKYASKK